MASDTNGHWAHGCRWWWWWWKCMSSACGVLWWKI